MWDGMFMLLSLSTVMFIASFLAGSLPLSFSLSHNQLRFISSLGTGVLVGTALIVIIPEGIETIYGATEHMGNSQTRRIRQDEGSPDHESHSESSHDPHAWIGLMLVFGFILMYLIDVLPHALGPSRDVYQPLTISLSNLSRGLHRAESPTDTSPEPIPQLSKSTATSIGLIIHAIADGIALGASSSAPSKSLSFVVFLAIMLHKAPAAFGLTSVLLKQGLSKRLARTHLAVFAVAAPVGAIGTWTAVNILGRSTLGEESSMTFATGCVLVFSGGTFLYVAMHAMQESHSAPPSLESTANGYSDPYGSRSETHAHAGKQKASEIGVVVAGMLLPLLMQVGHGHAH